MKITINYNGKTATLSFKQRQGVFNRINTLALKENGDINGTLKVDYGKKITNEFSFENYHDLKKKLMPCLEKELLRFISE